MSFISGDKMNIRSSDFMLIHSELSTMSIYADNNMFITTETGELVSESGTVYTIKSGGGSPSATNKVDINP